MGPLIAGPPASQVHAGRRRDRRQSPRVGGARVDGGVDGAQGAVEQSAESLVFRVNPGPAGSYLLLEVMAARGEGGKDVGVVGRNRPPLPTPGRGRW